MAVETARYMYLLMFCFLPKLLLFSLEALRCCNHSLRQQFKAASLKTRLCSVAKENEEFKDKFEADCKDPENPAENDGLLV